MANSRDLVKCIKAELKSRKISYRKLADKLGISESAVKKMFVAGNFSIERLDRIADVLELELSDLVALAADREPRIEQLTVQQEHELLSDLKLSSIAFAAINLWTAEEIASRYNLPTHDLVKYLVKLDKMGLIELQPNNRIKVLISNKFSWQKEGPAETYIKAKIIPEFLSSNFSEYNTGNIFNSGYLSEESRLLLEKRMKALNNLFNELCYQDSKKMNIHKGEDHTSLLMGMSRWTFSEFKKYRVK